MPGPRTLYITLARLIAATCVTAAGTLSAQLPDVELCAGTSRDLTAPSGFALYRWTDLSTGRTVGRRVFAAAPARTTAYALEARPALGRNRAVNGSFYDGDEAFESDYRSSVGDEPGTYFVAERPWRDRPGMDSCRDGDRSGPEFRLLANAAAEDLAVWRQRVAADPGSTYSLSTKFWPGDDEDVRLRFRVDGEWVGAAKRTGRGPCALDQVVEEYTVPAGRTSIAVEIVVVRTRVGTPIGIDAIVIAERFPSYRDTVVVEVVEPTPNDTTLIEACPGEIVTLADGTAVDADALVCRVAGRSACGESFACDRVRFLDPGDVVAAVADPTCAGAADGAVAVSLRGDAQPASVEWADAPALDDASRRGLRAGAYGFEVVRAGDGCRVAGTVELVDPEALRWAALAVDTPPCAAGDFATAIAVGAGGTGERAVGFRQNGTDVPATRLLAGRVEATVTDANGCSLTGALDVPAGAELAISGPAVLEPGAEATFEARLDGVPAAAAWSFGPESAIATGRGPATYAGERWTTTLPGSGPVRARVDLTEACAVVATWRVGVAEWAERLFPTAFSPNGDGRNDRFDVVRDPDVERLLSLSVYDRWGGLVHASSDGRAWGGEAVSSGRAVEEGVYVYAARVLLTSGREVDVRGQVGVFR